MIRKPGLDWNRLKGRASGIGPGRLFSVNLLPYHNIAAKKYEKPGQPHDLSSMSEPDHQTQAHVISIFEAHGLVAMIGG